MKKYSLMEDAIPYPPVPEGAFEKEEDWQYKWRRDMQEIIPGVYLGPYGAARKSMLENLLEAGITHIICVRHHLERNLIQPNFQAHIKYLVLEISDEEKQNLILFFHQANEFIDSCIEEGGQVLVHGNGGNSRSAALVIAYIMQHFGLCFESAFTLVQKKRFCIALNEGFVQQLREYEPIYRAQKMQKLQRLHVSAPESESRTSLKRKFEEDQETSMEVKEDSMDC